MSIQTLIEKYKTFHANTKENLSKTLLINTDEENESYFESLRLYSEIIKDLKSLVKNKTEVKPTNEVKYKKGDKYRLIEKPKNRMFSLTIDKIYTCLKDSNHFLVTHNDNNYPVALKDVEKYFEKIEEI